MNAAIPFSRAQFLDVFAAYNQAVWPAQAFLYLIALFALALTFVDRGWARGTVLVILGGLWLWMGVVYHLLFFTDINLAAWGFGAAFIFEALLLLLVAFERAPREPHETQLPHPPSSLGFGLALCFYALVAYPLIGLFSGHAYPEQPTFGLPCPTTIFTFGMLLLIRQRLPGWLWIIPSVWALIGLTAPFQFGIWQDLGLPFAAVISVAVFVAHSRRGAAQVEFAT